MRTDIRQIIAGKTYNTKTATLICSNEYWDGSNFERGGSNIHMYKSPKGKFFFGHSSMWEGSRPYIELVNESGAKEFYEACSSCQDVEYKTAFGIEPEIG